LHEKAAQFFYERGVLGEYIQSKEQQKYDKNDGQHSWNPNEFMRFHFFPPFFVW
jgi:hypothetical protein